MSRATNTELRAGDSPWHDHLVQYSVAVFVVALATILTFWTIPGSNIHFFEWFQAGVVVTAWYGGVGPGVLAATVSSLVIDYDFIPPLHAFGMGPSDLLRLVIFEAVAILTSLLSGRLKRANAELTRGQEELEERILERTKELSTANLSLIREIAQRNEAEKAILDVSNREQRRLGQDLHDGLSQTLAGVKLMTERVKREIQAGTQPESGRVALIEARLSEALTFVDTVSRGLYPVELETNGLMAALDELTKNTARVHPMICTFVCQRPVSLADSAVANHVYRIAQEAMANAVKNGHAQRIRVRLLARGNRVVMTVADNGIGLKNAPVRKGMGIKLMEHRAQIINGRLRFRSGGRAGTFIRCSFPAGPGEEGLPHGR